MSRMVKVRNDGARLAREFASVLTPLESETLVLMYEGEEMAARHRTAWPLTREALVQAGLVNKVGDSSEWHITSKGLALAKHWRSEQVQLQPPTWCTKGAEVVALGPTETKGHRMRARHMLTRERAIVEQRGGEEPKAAAERAARVVLGAGQLVSVAVDGGGWIFVVVPEGLMSGRDSR